MWFRRNFAHRTELLQQQAPYLHRILDDGAYSAKAAGAVIDYRIRGYLRSATVIHAQYCTCARPAVPVASMPRTEQTFLSVLISGDHQPQSFSGFHASENICSVAVAAIQPTIARAGDRLRL